MILQYAYSNNWLLGHTSNKLPLALRLIGHIPKSHLLKVSLSLLLAKRLCLWICHILYGVNSLHLDELLLDVFIYDVELLLENRLIHMHRSV